MKKALLAIALSVAMLLGTAASVLADGNLNGEPTSASANEAGISFAPKNDPIKIGYVCYDYTIEIWAQITAALVETCESYGWEITTVTCDNNAEKQVAAFENFIQAGVDGIISSCENGDSVMEVTEEAIAAGIPVVSLFYPYDAVLTYSAVDLYDTGYVTGKAAAEYLNEKIEDGDTAKVAVLDWPYNEALISRTQGMLTGFNDFIQVDYQIVTTQYATSEDDGLVALETILQAFDDIDVVLSQGSSSCLGAVTALEGAGVAEDAIALFACDTTRNALEYIKEGKYIYACSTYGNAHQMADPAAELLKEILDTDEIPAPHMLECFMIDPTNVEDEIDNY